MALDSKKASRILIALLLTATLARVIQAARKQTINHDEAISYLAATGHQGVYKQIITAQEPPFGVWAKSSEWLRLLRPEIPFCFARIGSDLAHFDIHPPLYFWLLHVWLLIFGLHLWTGPVFNTLIALGTALALFGLARQLLGDPREALIVTTLWAMSPTVIAISSEARQYDLLALITVLFAWHALRCSQLERLNWRDGLLIAALTMLGALIHYQFALVVMGGVMFLAIRLFRTNRRHLVSFLAYITVGYLAFVLLHPQFYLSIMRQRQQAQVFQYSEVPIRLVNVASGFLGFIMPISSVNVVSSLVGFIMPDSAVPWKNVLIAIYKVVAIALFLGLAWLIWATYRLMQAHRLRAFLMSFLGWTAGFVTLLYLACFSPRHAMGSRYLTMAWPFIAFSLVYALRLPSFDRWRGRLVVLLCVGMCLIGMTSVVARIWYQSVLHGPALMAAFTPGRIVLVDNVARGILPCIYFHIPEETDVFFADQNYLLTHVDLWLPRVRQGNAIYISSDAYSGTKANKEQILMLIREYNEVIPLSKGVLPIDEAYLVP